MCKNVCLYMGLHLCLRGLSEAEEGIGSWSGAEITSGLGTGNWNPVFYENSIYSLPRRHLPVQGIMFLFKKVFFGYVFLSVAFPETFLLLLLPLNAVKE